MIIETTALISIGSWLGNKLLDKGFDGIYEKVTSKRFNKKFYEKVQESAKRMQQLYPDSFGGNIEYFFKHEQVFSELIKLLFLNSKVDISIIEDKFSIDTLPDNFILQFINILREELYADEYFSDVLASKEIYLATIGMSQTVEEVKRVTNLSLKEIRELKAILSEKFKTNFSVPKFISSYEERLYQNYSRRSILLWLERFFLLRSFYFRSLYFLSAE